MRASHGLGVADTPSRLVFGNAGAVSGMDSSCGTFPSRADNGLRLSSILLTDGAASNGPRGELPGAYHCPQTGALVGMGADVVLTKGAGRFAGKTLLSISVGNPSSSNQGIGFFDVTTPWRQG